MASGAATVANTLPETAATAIKYGAGGAALAGAQYADTEEQRLEQMKYGAALGAAVPLAIGAVKGVGKALMGGPETASSMPNKIFAPDSAALKDVAYNVGTQTLSNPAAVEDATAAATRLGVPLTPGQAVGGSILKSAEKATPASDIEKRAVFGMRNAQETGIAKNTAKLFSTITPEGRDQLEQAVSQKYDALKNVVVDDSVLDTIKSNKSLATRFSALSNATDTTVSGLPDNSLLKVDALKKELDSTLFNDTFKLVDPTKKLTPDARKALESARSQLMDSLSPYTDYTEARAMSQRLILGKKYDELLGKIKPKAGTNQTYGASEIYNTLFSTPEKQKYFLKDIAEAGGDVGLAKDIIKVTDQLRDSPLDSILKMQPASSPDVPIGGAVRAIPQKFLGSMLLKRYQDAILNLMLSGQDKWKEPIKQILKTSNAAEKADKFGQILLQATKEGAGMAAAAEGGAILTNKQGE